MRDAKRGVQFMRNSQGRKHTRRSWDSYNSQKNIALPSEVIANPDRPLWLQQSPKELDLVFLDFETTGGNPSNSALIEIAAIKYSNGVEVGRLETLVNPNRPIPHIVSKITGITQSMVKSAPLIEEVFPEFMSFLGQSIVVAHGAQGDIAFIIHHAKESLNQSFPNFYFCTHLLVSHLVLENIASKSLTGLAAYFNIPFQDAHSAMSDADVTAKIFWRIISICEERCYTSCLELFKLQGDLETLKKLGPGINPKVVEKLPHTTGLFYLLNPRHEISYISASSNIKKSLSAFIEIGSHKELNRISVEVSSFKFERTSHLLEALIREKRELQRVSISLDPRNMFDRKRDYLQIFIPQDMCQYAAKNPHKIPFAWEHEHMAEFCENNSLQSSALYTGKLKEGIGYCFGPLIEPKTTMPKVSLLLDKFPIEYQSLSMNERFLNLKIILSFLHNNLNSEIEHIEKAIKHINAFSNFTSWISGLNTLKKAKSLLLEPEILSKREILKSGLAIISNNELKEFEVVVVVKNRLVKKTRLPFDEGERLQSPRYFTRMFEKHHATMTSHLSPVKFSGDVCHDIELFSYWLENKRGEGEWVCFQELANLYDPSVL